MLAPRLLRIFVAVAREGGIAAAARQLPLSPAAVSEGLSDLETRLRKPLFDRDRKRLRLNAAGAALLPRAEAILRDLADVERVHAGAREHLRVGASVTAGNYMLGGLVSQLRRDRPGLSLEIVIRNTRAIADAVEAFEVAVGFVEGPVDRSQLDVRPWLSDDLVLVVAPDHPLAGVRASPAQLASASWILREEGAGTRATFDAASAAHFEVKDVMLTVGGNELLKSAVKGGLGVGCLSVSAVDRELRSGELVEVAAPWMVLRRELFILTHLRKAPEPALAAVLEAAGEEALAERPAHVRSGEGGPVSKPAHRLMSTPSTEGPHADQGGA